MNRLRHQILWDSALFVFALASGVAVLVSRNCEPLPSQQGDPTLLFGSLTRGKPLSLGLSREGRTVHVTSQSTSVDAPRWVADRPLKRPGDAATIDAALSALQDLQVVRKLESGSQIPLEIVKSYGLDRPQWRWQIEWGDAVLTLGIGANAPPPRGGTYVEISGPSRTRQFYVVRGDFSRLELRPDELLEARLLPYVPSEVRELGVDSDHNHSKFRFDATRAGWYEAEGQRRRISRNLIDKVLFGLANLRAECFLDSASMPAQKSRVRLAAVSLGLDETTAKFQVEIYRNCDERPGLSMLHVSGADDVIACANIQELANTLDLEAPDWLDLHLFSLRKDEVESLTVNLDGNSLELERDESAFSLKGSESRRVDIDTGNDILQAWVSIHGTLASTEASHSIVGFDPQSFVQLRSAVAGPSDRYEERVLVGPLLSDGERWVKRVSDSAVLRIDSKAASLLNVDVDSLRSRNIINFEVSRVQNIELETHGRKLRWARDKNGALRPEPLTPSLLDTTDAESLSNHLAQLHAQKWLKPSNKLAALQPNVQVNFEMLDGDNAPRRYSMHLATGAKQEPVAWLGEAKDYFEPEPELVDIVARLGKPQPPRYREK